MKRRIAVTGKERLEKTIRGEKTDLVSWTTIIDDMTKAGMPQKYQNIDYLSLYREIRCDVMLFGIYYFPEAIRPGMPFELFMPGETIGRTEGDAHVTERILGNKKLVSKTQKGHPVKYFVETKEDLEILLDMWSQAGIKSLPGFGEKFKMTEAAMKNDGILALTIDPSPIQMLIEHECGPENFYYLMQDEPELMDEVITAIYRIRKQEYAISAVSDASVVIPVENTSSNLVSPAVFRKYTMGHLRDFADLMHQQGKKAIVHMCGHVKALLAEIKETGIDGIHALTEPPVGSCTFTEALDILGEDLIIMGTLSPHLFLSATVTRDEIIECIRHTLTDRIKKSNFILIAGADGIPTPLWKYDAVREGIECFGVK
jgi:hypothetical protein